MADNTTINPGSGGNVIATEDVSGVKYQLMKLAYGAHGAVTAAGPVAANNGLPVQFADSGNVDAFGRLRTSEPVTLFDWTSQFGDNSYIWETAFVGTGASSNLLNESTVQLTTGGTLANAKATRQTKVFWRYQPGKSLILITTFVLGAAATNLRKRIGYFSSQNGIFLEQSGGTQSFVRRTYVTGSAVDNPVVQSSWNIDKMDGTGPSGVTLDFTKPQIMVIDIQWLGVGRVRCGFDVNGILYYAHQFLNANNAAISTVYMTTACLPVRAEIENTGVTVGTNTMNMICASVQSGAGFQVGVGGQFGSGMGATQLSITTRVPLCTLRAKTTGPNSVTNRGQIRPTEWEVYTDANIYYEVVLNGTLGGGTSYAAVNSSYSIADFDTASTTISGGISLHNGYLSDGGQSDELNRDTILAYSELNSTQDTLTVCATRIGSGACHVSASINWIELI